jgi:predicted NBD/HSP70 family sugar kinase
MHLRPARLPGNGRQWSRNPATSSQRRAQRDTASPAARLKQKGELDARDVTEAVLEGNAAAGEIWDEVGWYLGIALTSFQGIYDPNIMLAGGRVAAAGEILLAPARRTMAALGSPYYLKHLREVRQASLVSDAGLIGAAALILLPESLR